MAKEIRPNIDSREGFSLESEMEYLEENRCPRGWEEIEGDEEPTNDDLEEMEEYWDEYDDGQPSEYDEWQDLYGGDDWDHGQYDYDDY